MLRDDELNRLVKYAQGLNVQVKFRPFNVKYGAEAEWTIDGTEITIFKRKKGSKLRLILCLIHEIAHHLEHIHNNDRKPDPKLEEALDEDDKKKMRKRVYEWELKGAQWWETIYKETDLKFKLNKLYMERDFDLWMYEIYYETGYFPNRGEQRPKRKELRKKYGYR